ncbi:MAG: roadblock/LC7 domain-containing protein [Candidatus Hodarchaeota archaeon]
MKEIEKEETEDITELIRILNEIKNKGNFTGIFFAKRNGELINENSEKSINSKEFVSMCASVLEGATGLSKTMGSQKINKIIAELKGETIIIVEIDKNSFLTCILNTQSNSSIILDDLEKYIHKILSLSN